MQKNVMSNGRDKYWIELAEYDLETAKAMQATGRYLYVGFMCHQVVEKALKALIAKSSASLPPKIHNLNRLAMQSGVDVFLDDKHMALLDVLSPLNIEARYPSYREKLVAQLGEDFCREMIVETEDMMLWIKAKL
jgi:HEPN domain-containing protein